MRIMKKSEEHLMLLPQQHKKETEEVDVSNELNVVSVCNENSVNVNVSLSRYMD